MKIKINQLIKTRIKNKNAIYNLKFKKFKNLKLPIIKIIF